MKIYKLEYYSALKNEVTKLAGKWIDFEYISYNLRKKKNFMFSFICGIQPIIYVTWAYMWVKYNAGKRVRKADSKGWGRTERRCWTWVTQDIRLGSHSPPAREHSVLVVDYVYKHKLQWKCKPQGDAPQRQNGLATRTSLKCTGTESGKLWSVIFILFTRLFIVKLIQFLY